MKDTRRLLPSGTKIRFESGSIYEISGEPIGFGGGSIIYPAVKYAKSGDTAVGDGLDYVLKECFPVSAAYGFTRRDDGEIVPEKDDAESAEYLRWCKEMQLREEAISKSLYKTAIHTLPIKESAVREEITLPGQSGRVINNVFTLMDSLSLKGASLSSYTKARKMLPLRQSFSVVRQLLYALKEMHGAGFLHLDIQTGNIFIQGSLMKGESIVTLIDFGCARELKDGHTDVIGDRIVFTTPGFTAPEILLHNDGTLMLTPAADIYSAGCVLLNLLTGKKYGSDELISNRTGRYIDAMKLYRINCPRHLTDKLQRIIAKALENEPGERYPSADAMLEDVEAFLSALPLTVTPLSNTAFNAFISYRHGDIDSRAALEIQKRLERFRAPKEISSLCRPFKKCYVDERELSSGYDYAKQLREVLKNSEWLIVVCSPGTGDSRWVNEEIDIFLEYHDRSRVLAILTGGEPEQSFPPRLLEETPQGDLLIAADARGETLKDVLSKIRGDALLKLAAPMLSTTFDSLKQREKIYRLRRAAASAAVLAVFAAAFGIYAAKNAATIAEQAKRIEEEYKTSLINESLFLTEQANKRLDDDDITGAIELTLRALPSETQDRPLLPEAKNVLETALGAYVMPGSEDTFEATKCFSMEKVYKMFACGDKQHMLTLEDERKRICLRDTDFNLIKSVYFPGQFIYTELTPDLLIPDRSEILFTNCGSLYRWNYESGELTKLKDSWVNNVLLSPDGSYAAIICDEKDESFKTFYYIGIVDTRTGEISKTFLLDGNYPVDCMKESLIFSPDGSGLYFAVSDSVLHSLEKNVVSSIYYLDFTSGEISALFTVPYYICATNIIDRYLVGCSSHDLMLDLGNSFINRSKPANLFIYDIENGEMVCCIEETKFGVGYDYSIEPVDFDDGSISTKAAAFVYADFCEVIELNSGKILRKYDFSSPVVLSKPTGNGIYAILRNGCMTSFDFSENGVPFLSKYLQSELDDACIPASGCVFVRTEDMVLRYELAGHDKNFTELASAPVNSDTDNFLYESGEELSRFALLDNDLLYITETRENKCTRIAIPFAEHDEDEYITPEDTLLGSSPGGDYFYVKRCPHRYLDEKEGPIANEYYIVSVRDGSAVYSDETIFSDESLTVKDSFFFEGCVYYAACPAEGNAIRLLSWTPGSADTLTLAAYDLPGGLSFVKSSLNVTEKYICFALKDEAGEKYLFVAFDRGKNRFLSVSDTPPTSGAEILWDTYTWDTERREIIYMLHAAAEDGAELLSLRISSAGGDSVSVEYVSSYDDYGMYRIILSPAGRLFVVDENGVSEYSHDGELLNRIESSQSSGNYFLYNYFNYSFIDEERLLICAYTASYVINLSDNRAAAEEELVFCVGCDVRDDSFIVFCSYYDDDGNSKPMLGSFHRYSLQELIEMGRDFIK